MGLDQYAYKIKKAVGMTDFDYSRGTTVDSHFDYWRKFYGLQDWVENLYREKGGKKLYFNCVPVRLTEQDIDRLDRDMEEDEFYEDRYCETLEEEKSCEYKHLKDFIKNAKQALADGYAVYYDSWW